MRNEVKVGDIVINTAQTLNEEEWREAIVTRVHDLGVIVLGFGKNAGEEAFYENGCFELVKPSPDETYEWRGGNTFTVRVSGFEDDGSPIFEVVEENTKYRGRKKGGAFYRIGGRLYEDRFKQDHEP